MGSFWRFVIVTNGKLPVFGMFRSETFFYWSQSIPDFENLKDFERLCFGLHTCFTGVKRECRVWKNLFLTILNPFTSLAFKHILSFDLKLCSSIKTNFASHCQNGTSFEGEKFFSQNHEVCTPHCYSSRIKCFFIIWIKTHFFQNSTLSFYTGKASVETKAKSFKTFHIFKIWKALVAIK